jgi:hypothetical protein
MTKRRRWLATMIPAASLAALALGGLARAQTSLGFTNGNFELGVTGPTSPFSSSTGWNTWLGPAASGSDYGVAMSGTPPKIAEDGSFYAFFHATANIADCIGQQLNTVVGHTYVVSFWLATDGPTNAQSSQMQLSWGPDFGVSSNDGVWTAFQSTSATALPYQHMTQSFTAVTSHDILAFHGYDATSNILLDNVTVTPAPSAQAPAAPTWALISLGAAIMAFGVGLGRRRVPMRPSA